jgi:histidinol dehydrogenase
MRIIRFSDKNFAKALAALKRKSEPAPHVEQTVREIIAAIRSRGDAALLEYTEKFGGPKLKASQLKVSDKEIAQAEARVSEEVKAAIAASRKNVHDFAMRSLRKNWSARNGQGAKVGERFDPFQRVGIYVPGGNAPLVSSAVMTVALAAAAGVPEIVVTTPADKTGKVNDALLYALRFCGATEIYKVGGAQAVAAVSYGTKTIVPVLKIYGPGNAYVVEAKRQSFGQVAVDLLPGPSEILVVSDATGNPACIASDLLAQAEHGHGGSVGFVTDSARLLRSVEKEIARQLKTLSRQDYLAEVIEKATYLVQVKSMKEAVEIANDFAPEHLSLVARNDEELAAEIRTSGAIFLGNWSPVAAGDFLAGPSHELPTGGAGKSFPGLTVDQFQRRTSIVRLDKASLKKSLPIIEKFCEVEGLDAHARSAQVRFEAL